MPNTTGYSFGDVVLVPFPFTDQRGSKQRPASIVSSAAYNRSRPDVIIVAITSQVQSTGGAFEFEIKGWRLAGLVKRSWLKPVVTTIQQSLIIRRLGKLNTSDRVALKTLLQQVLADS